MADSKISALTASAGVGGSEQIPVNDAGTNKRITPAQILDYAKGAENTWTAKQTFNLFEAAAGTLTADTPFVISQTWNNAAVAFTGLKIDITNTASSATAAAVDVTVNTSRIFGINKTGTLAVYGGAAFIGAGGVQRFHINASGIQRYSADTGPRWSNNWANDGVDDLFLYRDAAGILAQRNVANAQAYRLYNTYTSGTNFERAKIAWESNRFVIGTEAATGTKRGITIDATDLILSSLPTADPVVAGKLWLDGTALKVSAGA